jgi:hypothetical protein
MLVLSSHITLGERLAPFDYLHTFELQSSWRTLTDTATLLLPKAVKLRGADLRAYVRSGDTAAVRLGYDGRLQDVYTGYVARVSPEVPLRVHLQDGMYLLKRQAFTASWRNVTLRELITALLPERFFAAGYRLVAVDTGIGSFSVSKATCAQVLDVLSNEYALPCFFRGKVLYAGLAYWPQLQRRHVFHFQKNVISHNLEWRERDDIRLKVVAISMNPNNTKLQVEAGDSDGETRTLHFFNRSLPDLKREAEAALERFKITGFRGSFTAFGEPFVRHGDIVELRDDFYQERSNGAYLVDEVSYAFGVNGYRQEITLGPQAS